jgi:hypothetical protein
VVVAAISDLHGRVLPAIPPCDLLLVAGDIEPRDWIEGPFANWLEKLECEVVGLGQTDRLGRPAPVLCWQA